MSGSDSSYVLKNIFQTYNITNGNFTMDKRGFLFYNFDTNKCGFPGFCHKSALKQCLDTNISSCPRCDTNYIVVYLFFVVLLSLAVFAGNVLILSVGFYRRTKKSCHRIDYFRSSLAMADLFTGVQILVVVLHNLNWVLNSTAREYIEKKVTLHGSSIAVGAGIFNLFSYTSSLYHLLYIGFQRLYAIKWPIKYKFQNNSNVYQGLIVVWIFSAVAATVPAWFPEQFAFSYYPSTSLYWPILKTSPKIQSYAPAFGILFLFYIFPFILMTCITVATGMLLRTHNRTSRSLKQLSRKEQIDLARKHELSVYKTVAIMQIGFTVTMIPLVIVVVLFYSKRLDCTTVAMPYLICFYLSMSNSIANVIIYSIRDATFRSTIKDICSSMYDGCKRLTYHQTEDVMPIRSNTARSSCSLNGTLKSLDQIS